MKRERRDVWASRVRDWEQSGKTAEEFASEVGVKASTLSNWRWKLRQESKPSTDPAETRRTSEMQTEPEARSGDAVEFVELIGVASVREAPPFELVLERGMTLRIPSGFDLNTLRELLAVIEAR